MHAGTDILATVRNLEARDREPLAAILRGTGVFSHDEVRVALELIDAVLGDPGQTDYIIATAVRQENEVVGYYCIGPTPMTAGTFDLYWIAVKPEAHNQGLGRLLLRHAEETARASGGRLMVAETSSQPSYEPTRMFYLRNAYEEVARIRDYYRPGDDLVVYGKYLSL
ncbi:MAG TPA: GNAT family N-acetyltransferase [Bacteroidota bacterium]|nr:GNAT family N-acetyltransferase [Bacteroidota bacterium]